MANEKKPQALVLITGQSGAGLGTAMRILEDLGFYCIDNLPFELVLATVSALEKIDLHEWQGVALCIHLHTKEQVKKFQVLLSDLKSKGKVDLVFLMAQDEILQLRYNTTRRKHPFKGEFLDLAKAIQNERDVLKPVENNSDLIVDTTYFAPQDLAWQIEGYFFPERVPRKLVVTVTSFGFKHGICHPLDMLFDVRFLRNPFFIVDLKEKNGLNPDVSNYVMADPDAVVFLNKLTDMTRWLLPRFYREGKHYFRIGIGCTGGKHRSVTIAEKLCQDLQKAHSEQVEVTVVHRDIFH